MFIACYYYKNSHHCWQKSFDTEKEAKEYLESIKKDIENEYVMESNEWKPDQLDSARDEQGREVCPHCKSVLDKCPIGHIGPHCPCGFNWNTGPFSSLVDGKKTRYAYVIKVPR